MSLADFVFERSREFAALEALKIRERRVSYRDLTENALRVAAALLENGADQETVAVVGQRKATAYVGILGVLYAGCSYTPVNPKYSEKRITEIINDARIRFAIGSAEDLARIEPWLGGSAKFIVPEGPVPSRSAWLDHNALAAIKPLVKPVDAGVEDLAYVLYTSGSTGKPKGVQVSHSNVLAFLRSMSAIYTLRPSFRASQTFDLSFDPSVSDMFFTWTNGGVLCVLPEEDLLLPSDYIRREGITFWNSVPSIVDFMNKMGALSPGTFPSLRYSMFCGEQFPKRLADAWRRAAPESTIENLYGPTEATIYISRYSYEREHHAREFRNDIIPIGRPFLDHTVTLVDDFGRKSSEAEAGEIVFKGPQVTKGYLHDKEKTDAVFVRFDWDPSDERWYRTGDLGFYNDFGDLECIGRRDNQIKLAGRRIEIGEIEAVLSRYPETHDAVVVPVRDAAQVVTGIVAFTTTTLSREREVAIRVDSTRYLERLFFPSKIVSIASFPVSASGKTDRKALAALAQQLTDTTVKQRT